MLDSTSMLYKLTILYTLHRAEQPISNNQISNFLLENDFTDYFNVQQLMGELIDDGYVTRRTVRNKTFYTLTESGDSVFKLLSRDLAPSIKADVDKYISDNRMEIKEELSYSADYYEVSIGHFNSHLYVEENGEKILEINVSSNSADEADHICAGWKKKSSELYPLIMSKLME